MPTTNYEDIQISNKQVRVFREVLQACWNETLHYSPKEWNTTLLKVTEKRRSRYKGKKRVFFYSWCGDWVTYHLMKAGCRSRSLNRVEINGKWRPGQNLNMLRIWAGDTKTRRWVPKWMKEMFPSARGAEAWHPWDNKKDCCSDAYVPKVGDLVICPRKNGDHIEFFVKLSGAVMTVSAGAQLGGIAMIRERDLGIESLVGIVDISKLACSSPY